MVDAKQTISTLLHTNQQLRHELEFYKSQFSTDHQFYLNQKYYESQQIKYML